MSLGSSTRCLLRSVRRTYALHFLLLIFTTIWLLIQSLPPKMDLIIDNSMSELNLRGAVTTFQNGFQRHTIDRKGGWIINHTNSDTLIWPPYGKRTGPTQDRIVSQMDYGHMYKNKLPMTSSDSNVSTNGHIVIYAPNMGIKPSLYGRKQFIHHECPIDTCYVFAGQTPKGVDKIDAIISKHRVTQRSHGDQVIIFYQLESPFHSSIADPPYTNWTATYRTDSTMVTPYEKFVPFDNITSIDRNTTKNYAAGKTKKVAWFVSNCNSANGRLEYGRHLAKYIAVGIYGHCGPLKCPRHTDQCYQFLNADYKFYLSFENSNCRDYITEKLYWNGYKNNIVPVVMGAHPDDYRMVAPPNSYIHVDDFESPKELAEYLHKLDQNDDLYNEYFRWKGTGTFIDTKFWCRLCAMLHAQKEQNYIHWYKDINSWWNGPDVCITPQNGLPWATWRSNTSVVTDLQL